MSIRLILKIPKSKRRRLKLTQPHSEVIQRFDRILSVEVSRLSRILYPSVNMTPLLGIMTQMFEHMKNYQALFQKISTWLRSTKETTEIDDPALLFVHIFCHKSTPYHFVEDDGWMAKNFFSGDFHHYSTVSSEVKDLNLSSITYYSLRRNNAFTRSFREYH